MVQYHRRIVGWAISDRMTSDLTLAALKMAIQRRQPDPCLIHHSDQDSQPLVLCPRDPQHMSWTDSTGSLGLSPGSLSPRIKETKGKGYTFF